MTEVTIDSTITTDEGMTVPAKITIEYPDDQGLYVYQVLARHADQVADQLGRELLLRGDQSMLAVLNRGTFNDDEG